jgi:hypothetical protein
MRVANEWSAGLKPTVEDERVENENQDDGVGPEKDMGESGGVWGARKLTCVG